MVLRLVVNSGLELRMISRKWVAVATLFCVSSAMAQTQQTDLRQQYSQHPSHWPAASLEAGVSLSEFAPLPARASITAENQPLIALGEQLFNDPILSRDHSISCASCHHADKVFSDGLRSAVGVDQQTGKRNTPALFAIELWQSFFWDGRTATALQQALEPIENPIEMDLPISTAIARLNNNADYQKRFNAIFGTEQIEAQQLAKALVAFEMQLTVPDTAFERFLNASYQLTAESAATTDITAELTEQQLLGLHLYRTKAGCLNCHNGAMLSDNKFHVTGLHFMGRPFEDLGRYETTGLAADVGKFRTPSLRAVTHTGPWMHNGLFTQFDGIIAFYNAGGARPKPRSTLKHPELFPRTSNLLVPRGLDKAEQKALLAFLQLL